jgi:hypothetical protein
MGVPIQPAGGSVIKRIQSVAITIAAGNATGTATITAVDTAKTFIISKGIRSASMTTESAQEIRKVWRNVVLTNSTTVTFGSDLSFLAADSQIGYFDVVEH